MIAVTCTSPEGWQSRVTAADAKAAHDGARYEAARRLLMSPQFLDKALAVVDRDYSFEETKEPD